MTRTTQHSPEESVADVAKRRSFEVWKRTADLKGHEHIGPTGMPHGLAPQLGRPAENLHMPWNARTILLAAGEKNRLLSLQRNQEASLVVPIVGRNNNDSLVRELCNSMFPTSA